MTMKTKCEQCGAEIGEKYILCADCAKLVCAKLPVLFADTADACDALASRAYSITVGETGNEQGHTTTHRCMSDDHAIRAARRMVAPYRHDGWWIVRDEDGRDVASGGRKSM